MNYTSPPQEDDKNAAPFVAQQKRPVQNLPLHAAALLTRAWQGDARAAVRLKAYMEGVARYQKHPFQRPEPPARLLAQWGSTRLLDRSLKGEGAPLLCVPSLVNPSCILDLLPETSLLEWLRTLGFRPLLLDWGSPSALERRFDLEDYVVQRLLPALSLLGEPVPMLGYCQGGLMALAATFLAPQRVRALALLATPWDFSGYTPSIQTALDNFWRANQGLCDTLGVLPMEVLQTAFWALDPDAGVEKFIRFSSLIPDGAAARQFVAVEDWANSGAPIAAPVAHHAFERLFGANDTGTGHWRVAGISIDPARRPALPYLVATSQGDKLTPPAVTQPLVQALDAVHAPARSGHVGMIIGHAARSTLWHPLGDFFCATR